MHLDDSTNRQEHSNVQTDTEFTGRDHMVTAIPSKKKACAQNQIMLFLVGRRCLKVKCGDTSDWRTGALMNRMKSAINKCAKENNI